MNDIKQEYMLRALELAEKGRSYVNPNPMVGCVIVHNSQIIGEGYHEQYGQAHAEVHAVQKLSPSELVGAHVVVTLEPCSHHGKTPPCAEMLSRLPIESVTYAVLDPNPLVASKGLEILRQSNKNFNFDLF